MKTKEEILAKHYPHFDIPSGWMFDGSVSDVFSAMDEYAKQQAIDFAGWAVSHGYLLLKLNPSAVWVRFDFPDKELSPDQLYAQFIEYQSLNK